MARVRPILLFLAVGALFYSCSPHSSEEFHKEGEVLCRSLVEALQTIESSDQLLLAEPLLKKKFESLVSLMIESSKFQQEHPDDWSLEPGFVSVALRDQLHRIYLLEGGREVIERAQQESLVKLDAYERSRLRQREKLKS